METRQQREQELIRIFSLSRGEYEKFCAKNNIDVLPFMLWLYFHSLYCKRDPQT